MPKRNDIKKIMLIGSGPIVIGQACEFDYSGTQACKALMEEGFEIVLVNSNPATIMTDPEFAQRTYIEPINAEMCEKIIKLERPDALLPTLGGQTGLNVAVELAKSGVLDKYGVKMIGANLESIEKAEDRQLFSAAMNRIGVAQPKGGFAYNIEDAWQLLDYIGFPAIIRPSYTLGGTGGGIAYNKQEFEFQVKHGLELSPISEVLIEESLIGWKEFELEVMRDLNDNVVIICTIENLDPMGVHTGDSITVAPIQTLTDREYQRMRDWSIDVIREIGVETGGSNIQFAQNPEDGRLVIIEMNPRVSRSSALASKATGFPIAKIAAKLAVGYTLDEIANDITRKTKACFEPTIDYCVVKIPRWTFEKFPNADSRLGTQMKSVGEVMAIGRTFKEALQKGVRSLEISRYGLGADGVENKFDCDDILAYVKTPKADRLFAIHDAFLAGKTVEELYEATQIDRWFLSNIRDIVDLELELKKTPYTAVDKNLIDKAKEMGFSDRQLSFIWKVKEKKIRELRESLGVKCVYKTVDTCGAEFEAFTPYHYSTYENECEVVRTNRKKIMIIGGGPNRIGQGIEFDYCCVHASFALREDGYETIMVNSNPETVSTDYDTSDKLYFEPLTLEDVLAICEKERPDGVIVQFGGQTPLKLAKGLEEAGVPIIGTSPESIDIAEDRKRFGALVDKLGIKQPPNGTATDLEGAIKIAERIGYPVLVRPSYVLGGRAMMICYNVKALENYMRAAIHVSEERPVLVDKFLESAIEVDVDAICDGVDVVIGGIMQHIENAGIHSGDSACILPTYSLEKDILDTLRKHTYDLARELNVIGLMNIQYAVKNGEIYVLEVNPRASRTVPFVSKSIGFPLAKIAARVMTGKTLKEIGFTKEVSLNYYCIKEAVLPFIKFPGVDAILGPEMKSTGEVMGIDKDFGVAFAKSQISVNSVFPTSGRIFISVNKDDRDDIVPIAKKLRKAGLFIVATAGTKNHLETYGIEADLVLKIHEGRPNVLDLLTDGSVGLMINTPIGRESYVDDYELRRAAIIHNVPYTTTIAGAIAAAEGILSLVSKPVEVKCLQEYHKERL
ncbi:MAG: carbamoyl-phosphate synthase large subunit [Candidatus Latescibacteria bacterium]|nr:carbamoyl-phosphate synthase large subunit [Candidatus Latescibacterota bacterium]